VRTVAGGLCVQVAGSGPPVVLLHSGVTDSRTWDEVAQALAPSYTVVRPDRRGSGFTPAPTEGFRHLDDLLMVLEDLDLRQVAVVGNSAGGKLALDLAVRSLGQNSFDFRERATCFPSSNRSRFPRTCGGSCARR
jgi:pimeloyl-ACP methyl ester carboxylesterase